jgi:hypothetical protein
MSGADVGTNANHVSGPIQNDCPDPGIGVRAVGYRQFERPAHEGGVVLTTQAVT